MHLFQLKKAVKVKAKIVRAIPLPPISLKKGPIPICPPNKKVKAFFDKIGTTVEIKTCTKTGCATADKMTSSVSVE